MQTWNDLMSFSQPGWMANSGTGRLVCAGFRFGCSPLYLSDVKLVKYFLEADKMHGLPSRPSKSVYII